MRKHIRGIVLVLLILLLPCLVWAEDEPENDIEITLNWGFNGKAGNSDACLPVTATLTNHGEAFEGQLEMEVPVAGNQESDLGESLTMIGNDMDYTRSKVCVWKKNIALAAGETRQETFYLTFPWANGTVQAYLKDGSRTVQTASLSKNFSANQDIALIGVIGAQPEETCNSLTGYRFLRKLPKAWVIFLCLFIRWMHRRFRTAGKIWVNWMHC